MKRHETKQSKWHLSEPLSPARQQRMAELPVVQEHWVCHHEVLVGTHLGKPVDLFICFDLATGAIRQAKLERPGAYYALGLLLFEAIERPLPPFEPALPSDVSINETYLGTMLRRHLRSYEVNIRTKEHRTAAGRAVQQFASEHAANLQYDYLQVKGVSADDVAAFVDAAARLKDIASSLPGNRTLVVDGNFVRFFIKPEPLAAVALVLPQTNRHAQTDLRSYLLRLDTQAPLFCVQPLNAIADLPDKQQLRLMTRILEEATSVQPAFDDTDSGASMERMPPSDQITFRLEVVGTRPLVWRRFVVPSSLSLHDLHQVIQTVMEWQDCHLYHFAFDGATYTDYNTLDDEYAEGELDAAECSLSYLELRRGATLHYLYDFGDSWQHELRVEAIEREADPAMVCLDGERGRIPEDCGGVRGYEHLLNVLSDCFHDDYDELKTWVGRAYKPEKFDRSKINRQLLRLQNRMFKRLRRASKRTRHTLSTSGRR